MFDQFVLDRSSCLGLCGVPDRSRYVMVSDSDRSVRILSAFPFRSIMNDSALIEEIIERRTDPPQLLADGVRCMLQVSREVP
jgi:hypothetical protein